MSEGFLQVGDGKRLRGWESAWAWEAHRGLTCGVIDWKSSMAIRGTRSGCHSCDPHLESANSVPWVLQILSCSFFFPLFFTLPISLQPCSLFPPLLHPNIHHK